MRTSGKASDLPILLIPLTVLLVTALAFAGRGGAFFPTIERHLWNAFETAGRWIAGVLS